MKNYIRRDGKNKKALMLLCACFGLLGVDYFYLKKWKLGFIKLGISWLGATIIVLAWIVYGSADAKIWEISSIYPGTVIASWIGAAILFISLIWTLANLGSIALNHFKDEHNQSIAEWNSDYTEYVKYILDEKNYVKNFKN